MKKLYFTNVGTMDLQEPLKGTLKLIRVSFELATMQPREIFHLNDEAIILFQKTANTASTPTKIILSPDKYTLPLLQQKINNRFMGFSLSLINNRVNLHIPDGTQAVFSMNFLMMLGLQNGNWSGKYLKAGKHVGEELYKTPKYVSLYSKSIISGNNMVDGTNEQYNIWTSLYDSTGKYPIQVGGEYIGFVENRTQLDLNIIDTLTHEKLKVKNLFIELQINDGIRGENISYTSNCTTYR